jgi:MacB-like periplasmic core domain
VKQAVRDQRASTTVESVLQDIRYGLRQMRHNPAFTWTAVITLGLGIGATTAIFSAVYALLIRPLPYPGSGRLMEISMAWPKENGGPLVSPDFVVAQSSLKSFSALAGSIFDPFHGYSGDQNLTGTVNPARVKVVGITANYLAVLHVTPAQGRNLLSSEDREGGPAVALLSHRLWETEFNSDPRIIGSSITLGGKAWTVVGVLPAHFIFPDPAVEPDVYIPSALSASTSLVSTEITVESVQTIGQLRDGVSVQQAQAELKLFGENRVKGYSPFFAQWAEGRRLLAEPLQHYLTG